MANHFQFTYIERLQSWNDLRATLQGQTLEQQCVAIDHWWQQAPLVNHYLHLSDIDNWPGPWQLLHENEYCQVAKALGMCYTLYLLGITDFEMVEAVDEYGDDIILVVCEKYAMNWHPNTILNTHLTQFKIKQQVSIHALLNKIK